MARKSKENHSKATEAETELRIEEVMQLILSGAMYQNIRQYTSGKQLAGTPPWNRGPGQKPLHERTLREYMARATERIVAAARESEVNALEKHIAMRRDLYARALEAGEHGTALSIMADLAKLTDLYPAPKKQDISITAGIKMEFVEELVESPAEATPDA